MRQERQENSMPSDDTGTDVPRQAQRGLPRALTLLWRGVCLRCPRCGARSIPLVCDARAVCRLWAAL